MQLTQEEMTKIREIFHLSEDVNFDVYTKTGTNRVLASIDVPSLFEPHPNNLKTTIANGVLYVAIIKETQDEVYAYVGEPDFLTSGVL